MENYKHFIVLVVLGFMYNDVVLSQNVTSPDPRCPDVDKSEPGVCDFMCYDGPEKHMREALSCPAGQICCPTSCDGRSCIAPGDIKPKNACASRPCLNGGVCKPNGTSFSCECTPGHSGLTCDVTDPCDSNPCLNGGGCFLDSNFKTYSCYCLLGFTGKFCETKMDLCANVQCQNGGKCIMEFNKITGVGFKCQCKPGANGIVYTGEFCEVAVRQDPCSRMPCVNGGFCIPSADMTSYTCTCQFGFTGKNCQQTTDPCARNPCANGGYCTPSADMTSYTCTCQSGFTGKNCNRISVGFSPCSGNPCLNGGLCVPYIQFMQGQDYFCQCPQGYSGNNCEIRNPLCSDGQPQHSCSINPCMYQTCPGVPNVICRPDYCGGCNARFYVDNIDITSVCDFGFSFW